MSKVWKLAPHYSDDLTLQVLSNRGIKSKKDIEEFIDPKIEYFESDLNIPNIKKAQERIKKAIELGEQIIVYGDYDVDGVCASALLYKALVSLNAKVLPYIPHREKEGYGLSKIGLDNARDLGASLVITVDHGIVAFEMAKYAKEIGLDLIITDHHMNKDTLPEALVIVHSIKMCGTAVGWCVVRDMISESLAQDLLEFVALATVCDMMVLLGVNRYFVKEGLKKLNKTKNIGLLALFNEVNLSLGDIDSYAIGHILGPRINAIGRLEHAIDALRLMCTQDRIKARRLSLLLSEANLKRQELTQVAVEEAKLKTVKDAKIQIIDSPDWVPGIIGLIAARVCEEYSTPTIAISVGETYSKGSARSIDGVNIVEEIRKASGLLVDIGGHKGAAGFTIETSKIEEFKKELVKIFDDKKLNIEKVLDIDATVTSNRLTKQLVHEFSEFEPFGFGNPQPVLSTMSMEVSDIRTVGEGKHLKLKADNIDAIAFGFGDKVTVLKNKQLVNLAYTLEINKFNGTENLQLKVKDIEIV